MAQQALSTSALDRDVNLWLAPGHPDRGPLIEDPFPLFDRLREHDPVFKSSAGPWIVTRYDDVQALLRDSSWSRDARRAMNRYLTTGTVDESETDPIDSLFMTWMLYADPPDHTRLRRLVQRAFTPKAIEQLAPRVETIARRFLTELREREQFDFLTEFATRLPITVIGEMIGLPNDRLDEFMSWTDMIVQIQEPGKRTPEFEEKARAVLADIFAFFNELVAYKRRHPGDDIVTVLLESEHSEDRPATVEEIVGSCILLHVGGQETTMNRIASGLYYLIQHPDQYSLVRNDLALIPPATEEILRYSALHALPRYAIRDMPIGDSVIPAGAIAIPALAGANRDPSHFDDPHRFDVLRPNAADHITFGGGIHYCLGVHLAKAEVHAAFRVLFGEFPELELASDTITWRDTYVIRGLSALPVRWKV